jgi:hypothetical protein
MRSYGASKKKKTGYGSERRFKKEEDRARSERDFKKQT